MLIKPFGILSAVLALPATMLLPRPSIEPTVEIVQAAYEQEAGGDDGKHDKDLLIDKVKCSPGKTAPEYLCWVTFTSKADAAQTLYFDVAAVESTPSGWKLKSGLCRR